MRCNGIGADMLERNALKLINRPYKPQTYLLYCAEYGMSKTANLLLGFGVL